MLVGITRVTEFEYYFACARKGLDTYDLRFILEIDDINYKC